MGKKSLLLRGSFFRRSLLANWLVALGRLERHPKLHQRHITVGLGVVSSFIHREGKPCFRRVLSVSVAAGGAGTSFQCTSIGYRDLAFIVGDVQQENNLYAASPDL